MSEGKEIITVNDTLFRRVVPVHLLPRRVSSAAFKTRKKKPDGELSVDLARLTTPERTLSFAPSGKTFGVLALPAAVPMDNGLEVVHDPCLDEGVENDAHCLVMGNTDENPKWKQNCKLMAEASTVVIEPVVVQ